MRRLSASESVSTRSESKEEMKACEGTTRGEESAERDGWGMREAGALTFTDLTSSDALGCRIFSKKLLNANGADDALV